MPFFLSFFFFASFTIPFRSITEPKTVLERKDDLYHDDINGSSQHPSGTGGNLEGVLVLPEAQTNRAGIDVGIRI